MVDMYLIYYSEDHNADHKYPRLYSLFSNPLGPFKATSYRFHIQFPCIMSLHERLNFRVATELCMQVSKTIRQVAIYVHRRASPGGIGREEGGGGVRGRASPIRTSELKRSLLNTTQEANLKKS